MSDRKEPQDASRQEQDASREPQNASREPQSASREPEAALLARHGITRLRAENVGPLSLSGTNTWIVGREPAYVIDPGPLLPDHLERLLKALRERGGLGGIALTHDHIDHCEAVQALRERMPAPLAAGRARRLRGEGDVQLRDGVRFGPLRALATPGHAPDHFALLCGGACFTGDAVLGEGSVFISPDPGALASYLRALQRLLALPLKLLCPGHGPPISQPQAKLRQYIDHRLDRERRLLHGLAQGARTVDQLLDAAWSDVPQAMRPFAAITLAAHLDKLAEEGRLPEGVERPSWGAQPEA